MDLRIATIVCLSLCLLRFAQIRTYKTYPALCLYLLAYLLTRLPAPHLYDPGWWHSTWLWMAAVLLPLRLLMLAEVSFFIGLDVPERKSLFLGLIALSVSLICIPLPFQPLSFNYYSFVAVRQYVQIGMAAFALFGLLYLTLRPTPMAANTRRYGIILTVLLFDYAVASAFDAHTGLAAPFVAITGTVWRTVRSWSAAVALACFVALLLSLRRVPPFWTRPTLDVLLRRRSPLPPVIAIPPAEFAGRGRLVASRDLGVWRPSPLEHGHGHR